MFSHNKLHFEQTAKDLLQLHAQYKTSLTKLSWGMDELRDSFHSSKEMIRAQRAEKNVKKYDDISNKKVAWISRVVLRVRFKPSTTSMRLLSFEPEKIPQLYFYRAMAKNRLEYISRLKEGAYSPESIIRDKNNRVTSEEEETLRYFIEEVNLYNKQVCVFKDSYLHYLKMVESLQGIF